MYDLHGKCHASHIFPHFFFGKFAEFVWKNSDINDRGNDSNQKYNELTLVLKAS